MKKINSLYFIVLLMFSLSIFSQPPKYYEKSFGWKIVDYALSIEQVDESLYLSTANNASANLWETYLVELDVYGNILNHTVFKREGYGVTLVSMLKTEDYFLLFGDIKESINQIGDRSYYAFLDENANSIQEGYLEDSLNQNVVYTALQTKDKGILLGGFKRDIDWEAYLVKIDSNANIVWSKTYPDYSRSNYVWKLLPSPDGEGYYALATVNFSSNFKVADWTLFKIDEDGNKVWEKEYDLARKDGGNDFIFTKDGGIFVLVSFGEENNTFYPPTKFYKLDIEGNIEWEVHGEKELFFDGAASKVFQLEDGSYIIGGYHTWNWHPTLPLDKDVQIAKLDSSGNLLWQRRYGGEEYDYAYDMIVMNDRMDGLDGFVLCGRTESVEGKIAESYLIKTNCMGLLTEPQSSFSAEQDPDQPLTYHFTNHSQYVYPDSIDGGHFLWDFGDGTTSEELHPSHAFAEKGESYVVTLTAVVCSDTSVMDIKVVAGEEIVSIDEIEGLPTFFFKLYPNPVSDGQLRVEYDLSKEGRLELYDLQGRLMRYWILDTGYSALDLGLENFVEGMYLYRLVSGGRTLKSRRLVVE